MKLNKYEKDIKESVESGEREQVPDFKEEAKRYQEVARATLRKDRRVNIRMTDRDSFHIQKKAMDEGLPYQTYISSILHKFINGRCVEKTT